MRQTATLRLVDPTPDLRETVGRYLSDLTGSEATKRTYRYSLTHFTDYLTTYHTHHLSAVDLATVKAYLRHEQEAGFKDATVNHRLAALRAFFGWAVSHGYLSEDPSKDVDFCKVRDRAEAAFLDAFELDCLLQTCDRNTTEGMRAFAMLRVLCDCGLRVSELCGLDVDDLDFRRGALFVRNGKGGKAAWVYFDNEARKRGNTRAALKDWLSVRPMFADSQWRQPLFVTRNPTRFTRQSAWAVVKDTARRSRLPREKADRITPHTLRHSFVTRVWERTGDIALTAKAARHTSHNTTLSVYTHIRDERLKEVAGGLWG